MKKEHRELRRRPLLTPLWLFALGAIACLAFAFVFIAQMKTTTVVLVRNAEKELSTIEDPPLSSTGEQRAELLARMFGERVGPKKLSAIFATNTRRAQATAAPLAARLGTAVRVVPVKNTAQVLQSIRHELRGRNLMVVGDNPTVAELVRILSGIDDLPVTTDDDYSGIYIVTLPSLGPPGLLRMSY